MRFTYVSVSGIECPTFAPATITPAVNPNVEHNPNPKPNANPKPNYLILTLPQTKNPIITLTLTLCYRRYYRRSKCQITQEFDKHFGGGF